MENFNKAKGDPLTAEEWNSLGGEIERLNRKIDEISIQFPTSEEDKKKYLRGDKTWGNPQVPTMSVNPDVDIVPASEASVEIEEQTENNVKFKFSLPQGKEGKAYVPNVDNEGNLTWELEDTPSEIEASVNIKGPQGKQGTGLTAFSSSNKDDKTTTVIITTNEESPQEINRFYINDGTDGHNPCLGVFADASSLPTTDVKNGDYAYADVSDVSHIFRYDSSQQTPWVDNGEGSPDNQTAFDGGNGPAVGSMKIDNTKLNHPASNALAKAVDVAPLNVKLRGVTADESSATPAISNGYVNGTSGSVEGTTTNGCYTIAIIAGTKSIRFYGLELSPTVTGNTAKWGYAFCDSSDNPIDGYYSKYPFNDALASGTTAAKEIVMSVPNDAVSFKCTVGSKNRDGFYCYLQSGETVVDLIPEVENSFNSEDTTKALSAAKGKQLHDELSNLNTSWQNVDFEKSTTFNKIYIGYGKRLDKWSKGGNALGFQLIEVQPGQTYHAKRTDDNRGFAMFAFLKTSPDYDEIYAADNGTLTPDFSEIGFNGIGNGGAFFINSNSNPEKEIEFTIPEDTHYLYVLRQGSDDIDRLPEVMELMDDSTLKERVSILENRLSTFEDTKTLFGIQGNQIKSDIISRANTIKERKKEYSITGRYTQPTSEQQKAVIDKINAFVNTQWTPKHNMPKDKDRNPPYAASVNVTTYGMPYSGNACDFKFIGINVSLYTYMTAINNPYSVLYTEAVGETGDNGIDTDHRTHSAWSRIYENHNATSYYGTVCCGFVSAVVGCPISYRNRRFYQAAKYYGNFIPLAPLGQVNWDEIQLSDVFDDSHHSIVIYDLQYDSNEVITHVKFAESSSSYPGCKISSFITKNAFNDKIKTGHSSSTNGTPYTHMRYVDLNSNKYDADAYSVPQSYNNKICTIYGDKVSLAEGELVVINYNLDNQTTFSSINIEKDGEIIDTYTAEQALTTLNNSEDYDPSNGFNVIDQSGHALVLGKTLQAGKYRAYLDNDTDNATEWEIVETSGISITKDGDGIYSVTKTNNTEMYQVYVGQKVENDYKGLRRYRTSRPLSYYENRENTFTLYTKEMRDNLEPIDRINLIMTHIVILYKGTYGTVASLPIELPTE